MGISTGSFTLSRESTGQRTSKHRRSAETHVAVSASAVSSPMRVKRDPWNRRKHSPSSSPASGGAASEERGAERGARVISG